MAIRMCLDLNKSGKNEAGPNGILSILVRREQQARSRRKMFEAPGSNACNGPLLDAINGMMRSSMDDLQPTNAEVKWRAKSSFKTVRLNSSFKSNNTY